MILCLLAKVDIRRGSVTLKRVYLLTPRKGNGNLYLGNQKSSSGQMSKQNMTNKLDVKCHHSPRHHPRRCRSRRLGHCRHFTSLHFIYVVIVVFVVVVIVVVVVVACCCLRHHLSVSFPSLNLIYSGIQIFNPTGSTTDHNVHAVCGHV